MILFNILFFGGGSVEGGSGATFDFCLYFISDLCLLCYVFISKTLLRLYFVLCCIIFFMLYYSYYMSLYDVLHSFRYHMILYDIATCDMIFCLHTM